MTPEAELEPHLQSDGCKTGTYQATYDDYKYSGYRPGHLIWPKLAGSDAAAKVATFTLTNIAPMEHSLFSAWKHAISQINNYAITRCGIPNKTNGHATPQTLHRNSVMYVIAGTVPSDNHVIGNDVNVPSLFWLSACCITIKGTSSFAIYGKNDVDSDIIVTPVLQLETMLKYHYPRSDQWQPIHLFPANNNECSQPQNDDSLNILI